MRRDRVVPRGTRRITSRPGLQERPRHKAVARARAVASRQVAKRSNQAGQVANRVPRHEAVPVKPAPVRAEPARIGAGRSLRANPE